MKMKAFKNYTVALRTLKQIIKKNLWRPMIDVDYIDGENTLRQYIRFNNLLANEDKEFLNNNFCNRLTSYVWQIEHVTHLDMHNCNYYVAQTVLKYRI